MSTCKNSQTKNEACNCIQCTCNYLAEELTKLLIQGCACNCGSFEGLASEEGCCSHSRYNQSSEKVLNLKHSEDCKCQETGRTCTKCHCPDSRFKDGNTESCKIPVTEIKKGGCSNCDCSQININNNYHSNYDNRNGKHVDCNGSQCECDTRTTSRCICCSNPKTKKCGCTGCKCFDCRCVHCFKGQCHCFDCKCSDCKCSDCKCSDCGCVHCFNSQSRCSDCKCSHCKCSDCKCSDCKSSHCSNNQCHCPDCKYTHHYNTHCRCVVCRCSHCECSSCICNEEKRPIPRFRPTNCRCSNFSCTNYE
ncbi:hypothetical protein KAFR_0E02580 [Kazachstania africana CBS 2517]|uniref:Uncharacterized protein n=1 Tax=Kazachstania africana (strain ATCC 22294 / BCRC 22015 / CBS 2517 / CECT 1963 / NBRC 1671 / NRRL Y-8276) TaxID=1071382 RepID=H2AVL1_KAZAF|nr:hypothetical protein KAFR_0E02580 [Kazachstania africana CBS 2517]CCF58411.1 hypothetical protein KAFR_0E02580 [Kazachstania africana CBS 2517]